MGYYVNPSLIANEAGADQYYGLPTGTLEALGTSESSQGTNTGRLGNIFQVLPSTAADPGYGLSGVNGNDPYSVGAYLRALINGPGGGSVANGLALYQGRPIGSTGNNAMTQFLNGIGAGAGAGVAAGLGGALGPLGTILGASPAATQAGASVTPSLLAIALRVAFVVLAIIMIGLGLAAIALKDSPQGVALSLAKKVIK